MFDDVNCPKSIRFGKNSRKRALLFSFVPRCVRICKVTWDTVLFFKFDVTAKFFSTIRRKLTTIERLLSQHHIAHKVTILKGEPGPTIERYVQE